MTRAAAFRQVAKQTGRKEGTVAVNYYYAAKKRGTKFLKRGRPKMVGVALRNGASSSIESVLKSLEQLIRTQVSELDALQRERRAIYRDSPAGRELNAPAEICFRRRVAAPGEVER